MLPGKSATKSNSNNVHLAVQFDYPEAKTLEIPPNIDPTESTRFSPLRNRDIAGKIRYWQFRK